MSKLLSLLFLLSSIASPATLLSVTGTDNNDIGLNSNQALAVSFTTTQLFSNVTFSVPLAELICLNCAGEVYLELNGIDSTAIIGNLIDAKAFNNNGPLSFTETNLAIGTYYVVLAITSGNAVWTGSTSPTVTTAPNVSHSIDYIANSIDTGFPPDSHFAAITATDRFYQLTTPGAATPEPTTLILGGLALIALLIVLRVRRGFAS